MFRSAAEGRQLDFADFTAAAQAVPMDHPLMKMRSLQTDRELDGMFADAYDPSTGRPANPPSQVVRMLILQFLHNLGDERVEEEVSWNLLFRRFVGIGWYDKVPDATNLSRFRKRVGPDRIRRVLDDLVVKARAMGLLDDAARVVDGTHIAANVARRSRRDLYAQGRQYVLQAIACVDNALATLLETRYPPVRKRDLSSPDARREEVLRLRIVRRDDPPLRMLGSSGDPPIILSDEVEGPSILSERSESKESFDDQDARFGHKTKDWTFIGFKAHEEIDPKSRLVTAVHLIPGNEPEPVRIGELLDREPGGLPRGAAVVGDAAYTTAPCHKAIRDRGGEPVSPRMKAARQIDKFSYDSAQDRLTCPAGKVSIARTRQENGTLHQFSMKDCSVCPLRRDCLRPSELNGKAKPRARVWLADVLKPKLAAGKAGAEYRKQCYGERYKVEGLFSEQKGPRSRLGTARYWGIVKTEIQVLLTAIATNALRIVRWLAKQPVKEEVPRPVLVAA